MSSQKKDVITLFRLFRLDKNFVFFYLVCNLGGGGGGVQWQIQKSDENPSTSRGAWGHAPS